MEKRIFISYSRQDGASVKLSDKLHQKLGEKGYDVFRDVDRIKTGYVWRQELNSWLCRSHGGVIIFSKEALKSAWVKKEGTILDLWKWVRKGFCLLPVFMPGVEPDDLKRTDFSAMQFDDIQSATGASSADLDLAADTVADRFVQHMHPEEECVLSEWAGDLVVCIKEADPDRRDLAAKMLDLDPNDRKLLEELELDMAYRLLLGDRTTVIRAAKKLARRMNPTALDDLKAALKPIWVSVDAANKIPPVENKASLPERNLAINATNGKVGRSYINRAHCRSPEIHIAETSGTADPDRPADDLSAFDKALRVELGIEPWQPHEELLEAIEEDSPVLLFVCNRAVTRNTVQQLRQKYRGVVLVLLHGPDFPDREKLGLDALTLIRPELSEEDEKQGLSFERQIGNIKRSAS